MDKEIIESIKDEIQRDIVEFIRYDIIPDNPEEREAAEVILTWLHLGKREAKKINKDYVSNLDKLGWTRNYKITITEDFDSIELCLLILGAGGFVGRKEGE